MASLPARLPVSCDDWVGVRQGPVRSATGDRSQADSRKKWPDIGQTPPPIVLTWPKSFQIPSASSPYSTWQRLGTARLRKTLATRGGGRQQPIPTNHRVALRAAKSLD